MPTMNGGVMRFDVNDPKDLLALIQSGLIWRGGPDSIDLAVEYLREHPEAINDKVPPAVLQALQPQSTTPASPGQPAEQQAPVADGATLPPEPGSVAPEGAQPPQEPPVAPPAP